MTNTTIAKLDLLLDKMIETDSHVTGNDLVNAGYYTNMNISEIEKDFSYLQSIYESLDVAYIIVTQDAEMIMPNRRSILFQKQGGFKGYYIKLKISEESINIETQSKQELDKLTKINLELQNKDLKRKFLFGIIGFISGALISNIKDILLFIKQHI